MKIVVLGAGLVGGAIIRDLAQDQGVEVTAVDLDAGALGKLAGDPAIKTKQADVSKKGSICVIIITHAILETPIVIATAIKFLFFTQIFKISLIFDFILNSGSIGIKNAFR